MDDLRGSAGNDVLLAGSGNSPSENMLAGGGGNDVLIGNIHADFLKGEAGKDLLVGGGGADKLDGGDGLDLVSYSKSTVGVTIDLSLRQGTADLSTVVGLLTSGTVSDATGDRIANVEGIIGSALNDTLTAGSETVVLYGADGNDTLVGGGGSILLGGKGDDKLYGKAGDTLAGGEGSDSFYIVSDEFVWLRKDGVELHAYGEGPPIRAIATTFHTPASMPAQKHTGAMEIKTSSLFQKSPLPT